ncbi:TspO/MBR family protein [Paludisphaera rhizosphaerae]|uniref:TspO/MBR family protein n=1 Tax=Paludisphaera rhizosphaerae TaxID=2711216 RepID=UPI00197E3325|nr:TspO/MBR family protein [Paludisphaera rhizosphaerae]
MAVERSRFVDILVLLDFLGLTALAAVIGSRATIPHLAVWYAKLRKPPWTPPNSVFGPVWTVLYILMAVAAWRIWRRSDALAQPRKDALACWVFQLALNVGWSWLFFGFHNPALAFIAIISLWLMIIATVISFARVDRPAAGMMAPYLLWVMFAMILNGAIVRLNL